MYSWVRYAGGSAWQYRSRVILDNDKAPIIPLGIGIVFLLGFKLLEESSYSWVAKARVSILAGTLIFGVNTAIIHGSIKVRPFQQFFGEWYVSSYLVWSSG
jgi:hypothetical protein